MSNKLVVCPACEGTGTDFDSAIEFTSADLDEQYADDWDAREQFRDDYMSGAYDTPCEFCHGERVVRSSRVKEWEVMAEWRAEIAQEAMLERYC